MFIFSKRFFIYSFFFVLLCSLVLNGVLFYAAKKFYTDFKITTVFPTHENFYSSRNAQLPEKKKQKRVVLFGDSRIHQWKNLPQIEGFEFVNRGISGEATAQLRARFEPDVVALDPDIVILQLGINDLTAIGLQPKREKEIVEQCRDNLSFFVETLLQMKAIEVILLTIIPPTQPRLARLPVWSDHIPKQVAEINQAWLSLPPTAKFYIIDTAKILKNASGKWHHNVNQDTLHLTPTGYQYLNQAVITILKTL